MLRLRPSHKIIGLTALIISIAWCGLAFQSWQLHRDRIERAELNHERLLQLMDAQLQRSIQAINLVLDRAGHHALYEFPDLTPLNPKGTKLLRMAVRNSPEISGLATVGTDGIANQGIEIFADGKINTITTRFDARDRQYFSVFSDDPSRELFIGKPIKTKTSDRWVVPISRPVLDNAGDFKGVSVAIVRLETFDQVLNSISSQDSRLAVYQEDGSEFLLPKRNAPLFQDIPDFASRPAGSIRSIMINSTETSIISYRFTNDWPFVILLETPLSVVLRSWRQNILYNISVGFVVTLILAGLSILLAKQVARKNEAETELKKLSSAVNFCSAIVIITDANGMIEYVNPQFSKISGYSAEEMIGESPGKLKSGKTTDQEYKEMWQTITSGETWFGEFHNRRKDGSEYWVSASISPIIDTLGTITNFVSVEEDITEARAAKALISNHHILLEQRIQERTERLQIELNERKQLEAQLKQSQRMEAVGQLTGGIAHDFNNLMAIMMGNLELAVEQLEPDAPLYKNIENALTALARGTTLTQQLLSFSRQQALSPVVADVKQLVVGTLSFMERTLGEDIQIVAKHLDEEILVNIDGDIFGNALVNLALNARDAMPNGGTLTVCTTTVELDGETIGLDTEPAYGPHALITVADTGSGISQDDLEQVLEPFFTTKEVGKGSGLGLSMVYGFVTQSNGHMNIASEEGVGTTISIYLPISDEERIDEDNKAIPFSEVNTHKTILLVEDDQLVRATTSATLIDIGYTVIEAEDGPSALEILRQRSSDIDLVLSDVVMPNGLSGIELAKQIAVDHTHIKILLTSGYPDKTANDEDIKALGIKLLAKPFRKIELAAAIENAASDQTKH